MIDGHFWVSIDDYQTVTWNFIYGADASIKFSDEFKENEEKRTGCGKEDFIPGTVKLKRNLSRCSWTQTRKHAPDPRP